MAYRGLGFPKIRGEVLAVLIMRATYSILGSTPLNGNFHSDVPRVGA